MKFLDNNVQTIYDRCYLLKELADDIANKEETLSVDEKIWFEKSTSYYDIMDFIEENFEHYE